MATISAAGTAPGFDATAAVAPAQGAGDRARDPANDDGFGAVMSGAIDSVSVTRRAAPDRAAQDEGAGPATGGNAAGTDGSPLPAVPPDDATMADGGGADGQVSPGTEGGAQDPVPPSTPDIAQLLASVAAGGPVQAPTVPVEAGASTHLHDGMAGAPPTATGAGAGSAVAAAASGVTDATGTAAALDATGTADVAPVPSTPAALAAQAAMTAPDARSASELAATAPEGDVLPDARRGLRDAQLPLEAPVQAMDASGQAGDDALALAAGDAGSGAQRGGGLDTALGAGPLDATVGADAPSDARATRADRADGAGTARVDGATVSAASDARAAAQVRTSSMGELFAQLQPDALPEQLGQRVLWMQQAGVQLARLQVHPVELGPIDIALDQRDGAINVSMSAQHPATRDLLESHLPRLREQLAQDGAQVGRFDVLGGDAGSERERAAHERGEGGKRGADAGEAVDAGPAIRLPVRAAGLFEAYA